MDNYKVIFLQARAVENILRLIKKWSNFKFELCDRTHDNNNNMFNLYSAFPSSRMLYKSRNTIDSRFT